MTLTKEDRLSSARASLDGLSVGDAFGEQFFGQTERVEDRIQRREIPSAPWHVTDDTIMAMSIVDVLAEQGSIHQHALAALFGRRYLVDPARGYGGTAHGILKRLAMGEPWSVVAHDVFDGVGSMGNGGAMRAAPIGAFFHDDRGRAAHEARLSAEVTHAHPEGQAGAMAVAVAAAFVAAGGESSSEFFEVVLSHTPESETRNTIARASVLPKDYDVRTAVSALGNGSRVISQDTVPFALWCAAHNMHSYETALWRTVSGLGDRDTTCAIVGGIVSLRTDNVIPTLWLSARESLLEVARF
jgi:ADP-ribosylglycohydrolase